MAAYIWFVLLTVNILSFSLLIYAGCPKSLPNEIKGNCYLLQTEFLSFDNARQSCMKYGAMIVTVRDEETLKEIEKIVYNYLESNLEKALFWIGFKMNDKDSSKPIENRHWKWHYDNSEIIQKKYKLWDKDGGPNDKTLTCAAINASNNYLVKAVDCGAPVLPVICQMEEGNSCEDDTDPYLIYGDYCLAALNGVYDYNKISGACNPAKPTMYTEETKDSVIIAAKNYFLGGGIFTNLRRNGRMFYDMSDGYIPPGNMWENGEPRDNSYDCAGLSIQSDDTLKLKTLNCDFTAASLCAIESSDSCRYYLFA